VRGHDHKIRRGTRHVTRQRIDGPPLEQDGIDGDVGLTICQLLPDAVRVRTQRRPHIGVQAPIHIWRAAPAVWRQYRLVHDNDLDSRLEEPAKRQRDRDGVFGLD
jgi:hypothetical protein